jgi:hypothetical protein
VPIDKEQIRSDVTLELDDQAITMTEFGKAVEHFLALIRDVSSVVAPAKDKTSWYIDIYGGSAGLGVRAKSGVYSIDEVHRIREAVLDGLKQITTGFRPAMFTDSALSHSKTLAALVNQRHEPLTIRVWGGRENVVALSREVATKANSLLAPAYEDDGSVEGVLKRADGHDKRELAIFDTITDRGIRCFVDDELLREAGRFWFKRVEVLGKVRYRSDGQPVSVHARDIIPFPEPEDIPTIEEMRDLLKGA